SLSAGRVLARCGASSKPARCSLMPASTESRSSASRTITSIAITSRQRVHLSSKHDGRSGGAWMILGLFETHIDVADLAAACRFYGGALGLELGSLDEERRVAFYWVGSRGEAMLGLWEQPSRQIRPQHFAFRVSIEDLLNCAVPYLNERGLQPRN